MKRLCIFITHKYPFQQDETFIENEIAYLSASFDKVLVFAAYADKNDQQTRNVPANIEVYSLGFATTSIVRRACLGIRGFFHANKEVYQEVSTIRSIGWKLNCVYIHGVICSMESDAIKILSQAVSLDEFDSCLVYSYWFSEHALLAIQLRDYCAQYIQTKVISRAHRYDVYAYRKRYKAFPFKEKMMRLIDAVYPCSQDGTVYLTSLYPSYAQKIQTAYLGTADYGVNPSSSDNVFTIVSCSNIVPVKRVHLLAEALSLVLRQGYTDFRWICIGDGPLLRDLQEDVQNDLEIGSHVEFLGRLSNKEVMELYKRQHIDLFVNVSENEGLPVSIMEAQSFGIPCFATDVGGTAEILNNEVGALLHSDVTLFQLSENIMKLMDMRQSERLLFRTHARKNWMDKFSAEINFKKWTSVLLEGLGEKAHGTISKTTNAND